jgi:hypothetical protein
VPAAATTAAATEIVSATTSTAETAVVSRTSLVYTERAPINLLSVQLAYGVLGIGVRSHCDEGESSGFASEFILHQQHFGNCAGLSEHVLQLKLRRCERQVAYVQSISHNGNGVDLRLRTEPVSRRRYVAEETPLTDSCRAGFFLCCGWHEW